MRYEVIVIGGGHAGCEAAAAAARLGIATLLLTPRPSLLAAYWMLPHTGGPGRDPLLRQLDAAGGLSAQVADAAFLKIRRFSPRLTAPLHAHIDQHQAPLEMASRLAALQTLTILEDRAERFAPASDGWRVVTAGGHVCTARALVLAAGVGIGFTTWEAHTPTQHDQSRLSASLRTLGLPLRRFASGTSAIVHAATVDWEATTPQPGSDTPLAFSAAPRPVARDLPHSDLPFTDEPAWRPQLASFQAATTAATAAVIRRRLGTLPPRGVGPGHCPSLDVRAFARETPQRLWLHAVAWDQPGIVVSGLETCLPPDAYAELLETVPALEHARLLQPAQAFSYWTVAAPVTTTSLEVRGWPGLYLAGQILGTNGVAESAAQGLVAGLGAASRVLRTPPPAIAADTAIGRLLTTLTVTERTSPFRVGRGSGSSQRHAQTPSRGHGEPWESRGEESVPLSTATGS